MGHEEGMVDSEDVRGSIRDSDKRESKISLFLEKMFCVAMDFKKLRMRTRRGCKCQVTRISGLDLH